MSYKESKRLEDENNAKNSGSSKETAYIEPVEGLSIYMKDDNNRWIRRSDHQNQEKTDQKEQKKQDARDLANVLNIKDEDLKRKWIRGDDNSWSMNKAYCHTT